MELQLFARTLLFGTTLEEKLFALDDSASWTDDRPGRAIEIPPFPGRPAPLAKPGKADFPSLDRLHDPIARGQILHFFANHELLAFELMALLLLRFPEAPPAFRIGIARTIREEQSHLRLYVDRMRELGLDLGDIPVSDYFWKAMREMRSPLEFVTQMSLTFEQANLDFSLFFRDEIAKTGDAKTTEILDRVYREEIGHVKHGLSWFNRWREGPKHETDWDAYRRLLPSPMTPRRAKGPVFSRAARSEAGLSDTFIRELEIYSGAKGRPPVLWIYNASCDAEIARGRPGYSPSETVRRLSHDLEHLPMFLSSPQDMVLVERRPSLEWLEKIRALGFETPDWASSDLTELREPKFGGLEPWGWSPEVFEKFSPLKTKLVPISGGNAPWVQSLFQSRDFSATGLSAVFSKSWSARFLGDWLARHPAEARQLGCETTVGVIATDSKHARTLALDLLSRGKVAALKAPWSTSGGGIRRVFKADELEGPLQGWIENTIRSQGSLVVEPWLAKVCDLSIQMKIGEQNTELLEIRRFLVGKQNEYRGTLLGPLKESLDPESLRLLHTALPAWKQCLRDLASALRAQGYQGPAGVDALIYREENELRLKPMIELNPRWTMGRVALSLEEHIVPGVAAAWLFIPMREILSRDFTDSADFSQALTERYPPQLIHAGGQKRIAGGVLFTQDPAQAREVLAVLAVGDCAKAILKDLPA